MNSVLVILEKELRDLRRNWGILATMLVPAVIVMPLVGLYAARVDRRPSTCPRRCRCRRDSRATRGEAAQYMALMPFHIFWSAFSIAHPEHARGPLDSAGEKVEGTLEPLLVATPLRTRDLLLGKAIARNPPRRLPPPGSRSGPRSCSNDWLVDPAGAGRDHALAGMALGHLRAGANARPAHGHAARHRLEPGERLSEPPTSSAPCWSCPWWGSSWCR